MRKESALTIEEPRAHSVPWTPIRWCERIRRLNLPALRLRRVTDFIDTHLSSTIRIAELADLAQLSEGHFHRASGATTGTNATGVHARPRSNGKTTAGEERPFNRADGAAMGLLSPAHARVSLDDGPEPIRLSTLVPALTAATG
jgi:hypothetical protein